MRIMTTFNRKNKLMLAAPAFLILILAVPSAGFCRTPEGQDIGRQAGQHVEKAIKIQQKTHKDRTKWEAEKADLVLRYERLLHQKQILEKENTALAERQTSQETLNRELTRQKRESARVREELAPFIHSIYERLETLLVNDPPFLKDERTARLANLEKIMDDPDITIAEKYRKVMEALFVEAEYGSTIEVYQDKILLESAGQEETLGHIFRLGRVSLFFLSLDQAVCGVFNPGTGEWQALPDSSLPAIRSAVEIGSKRRPVELLPLPLGRLAIQGGDK